MKKEETKENNKENIKNNYLVGYVSQERKSFSCSNINNLMYQTLRGFDKGYSGFNDKFIINFIAIVVTVQKNFS